MKKVFSNGQTKLRMMQTVLATCVKVFTGAVCRFLALCVSCLSMSFDLFRSPSSYFLPYLALSHISLDYPSPSPSFIQTFPLLKIIQSFPFPPSVKYLRLPLFFVSLSPSLLFRPFSYPSPSLSLKIQTEGRKRG